MAQSSRMLTYYDGNETFLASLIKARFDHVHVLLGKVLSVRQC